MENDYILFDKPKPFTIYTINDESGENLVYTVEVDAVGVKMNKDGNVEFYETERYPRYPQFIKNDNEQFDGDNTSRLIYYTPNEVYFGSSSYYSEEKGYRGEIYSNTNATFVLEGTKEETYEKAMQLYQKALDAREAYIRNAMEYYIQWGREASKAYENTQNYTPGIFFFQGQMVMPNQRKLDYQGLGINTEIDEKWIKRFDADNVAKYKQIKEKFGEYFKNKYSDISYFRQALEKYTSPVQKQMAKTFYNLIEDIKTEQKGKTILNSNVQDVIRNETKREYNEKKENIEPRSQLEAAFAIYGTKEAPKEHFTSEEAYDIYCRIAPELKEIVANADEKTMADAVIRWSEMAQPLLITPEQKQLEAIREEKWAIMDAPKEMFSDDNFIAKAVAVNPRVLDVYEIIDIDIDVHDKYYPVLQMFIDDNLIQKTVEELRKMLEAGAPDAKENTECLVATLNKLCSESELAKMKDSIQTLKHEITEPQYKPQIVDITTAEPQVVTVEDEPEIIEDKKAKKGGNVGENR